MPKTRVWTVIFFVVISGFTDAKTNPSHLFGRGSLDEFDNIEIVAETPQKSTRMLLGDIHGFLHVYEQRASAFEEVWTSEFFEGPISHLRIIDINSDGIDEIIVVVAEVGRIHYLDLEAYNTLWSNPPNDYNSLTALEIHNLDEDPQPELLFCNNGHLIVYDGRDQFEEWRSEQSNLNPSEILVADVDGDGSDEIVLNDGYVFDARYRDLEWQSPAPFGTSMGIIDIDNDGILEVVGQFHDRFLRIFDIELRREKSSRR